MPTGSLGTLKAFLVADDTKFDKGMKRAERQARSAARNIRRLFIGVGAGFLAREIVQVATAFDRMESALRFATGSQAGAKREMAFVRVEAERLGLDLLAASEGYTRLAAASRGTALEGQATRAIFLGIAEAATVLGFNADRTAGSLLAVEQIVSKGKVSAEELRRQLGERLFGAFQIAARSIGVTTQRLDELLSQGKLASTDFLPALARELHRTFGPEVAQAAQNTQQQINRFKNTLVEVESEFADAGFVGGLTKSMNDFRTVLQDPGVRGGLAEISQLIGKVGVLSGIAAENVDKFGLALGAFIGFKFGGPLGALVGGLAGLALQGNAVDNALDGTRETIKQLQSAEGEATGITRGLAQAQLELAKSVLAAERAKLSEREGGTILGLFPTDPTDAEVSRLQSLEAQIGQLEKALDAAGPAADSTGDAFDGLSGSIGGTAAASKEAEKALTKINQIFFDLDDRILALETDSLTADLAKTTRQLEALAAAAGKTDAETAALVDDLEARFAKLRDLTAQQEIAKESADAFADPFVRAADNIQREFADTFTNVYQNGINSFDDLADAVGDIMARLAGEVTALLIFEPQALTSGGGGLGGIFGSIFGGPQSQAAQQAKAAADATKEAADSIQTAADAMAKGAGALEGTEIAFRSIAANLGGTAAAGAAGVGINQLLGITSTGGTIGGVAGAGIGAIIGAYFGQPQLGALAGALTGGLFGSNLEAITKGQHPAGQGGDLERILTGAIVGSVPPLALASLIADPSPEAALLFALSSADPTGTAGLLTGAITGGILGGLGVFQPSKSKAKLQTGGTGFESGISVASPFGELGFAEESKRIKDAFIDSVLASIVSIDNTIARELTTAQVEDAGLALQITDAIKKSFKKFNKEFFLIVEDRLSTILTSVGGADLAATFDAAAAGIDNKKNPEALDALVQQAVALINERERVESLLREFQVLAGTESPLTDVEQQLRKVDEIFRDLSASAKAVGVDIGDLPQLLDQALAGVRQAFEDDVALELLDLIDPLAAQLQRLDDEYQTRIREAEAAGADLLAVEELYARKRKQTVEQFAAATLSSIQSILSGALAGPGSPLAPEVALANAEERFNALVAAARAGDQSAFAEVPGAAQALLDVSRQVFASSEMFFQRFNFVISTLENLPTAIGLPSFEPGTAILPTPTFEAPTPEAAQSPEVARAEAEASEDRRRLYRRMGEVIERMDQQQAQIERLAVGRRGR